MDAAEPVAVAGGDVDRVELNKDEVVVKEGSVLFVVGCVENEDATFDINEEDGAPVGLVAIPFVGCVALGDVALCGCPAELDPKPIAISMMVGCFGSGGGVAIGIPNGFLEPVWCVFTNCGCSVTLDAGTDAALAGALGLGFPGSWAMGETIVCVLAKEGNGFADG